MLPTNCIFLNPLSNLAKLLLNQMGNKTIKTLSWLAYNMALSYSSGKYFPSD